MRARFRYSFIPIVLCVLFAGSGISQTFITSPPAVTKVQKAMPKLNPAISATRDLNSGKISVSPQSVQDNDYGDPTADEQYLLEMINRARANPPAEGIRLANTTDPATVSAYSYWPSKGAPYATPDNVKAAFATYAAKPPLTFNTNLISAARGHSQDMLDHDYQDHVDFQGKDPFERMNNAGYTGWDGAGENIAAYSDGLDETGNGLEIDFGQDNQKQLGHRQNIINFTGTVFSEVGIGVLHGGSGNGHVGTLITTEDFGHIPGQYFITGVIYKDLNGNNFYDIGEGLSGITVTASNGMSAVTGTAGGYRIPVSGSAGLITLHATVGGTDMTGQAQMDGTKNVKVDFIQGGFAASVSF